jgi:hypothetical protein
VVSANAVEPPVPFDRTWDLVLPNFPVNGFLLMIVYVVFILIDGPPVQQGLSRHLFMFLVSIGIVTFSGALIDTVAFLQDELGVYLAAAALIMCIVFGVSQRYIRMNVKFSLIGGGIFFIWNMIAWVFIDDWFWVLVDITLNFYLLVAFLVLCVCLVALYYHQSLPLQQKSEDPEGMTVEDTRGFKIDRRFYLEYWLPLEAIIFCILLVIMVHLGSTDPPFVWELL